MKRANVFMSRLKYGGMELSLINFLNNSKIADKYEVHLYLIYCLNEELLNNINDKVHIHLICKSKWNLFGKLITAFRLLLLYIMVNKCDLSICYSNHQQILSKLARKSSDNSVLFIHSDLNRYMSQKSRDTIKKKISFSSFNKIICVSEKVKSSLINLYDKTIGEKCYVIPNYIDGEKILLLSKDKIEEKIDFNIPTFINIANHVEEFKNINSIIDTAYELKKENIKFQILLIGEGPDSTTYSERIKKLDLNDCVKMLGKKSNPYPYLKNSKALLFTSNYEGYGMVLDEARVLNVKIISTGSGASKEICNDGYGIITNDLNTTMKEIIKNNKNTSKRFNHKKFNKEITSYYETIF